MRPIADGQEGGESSPCVIPSSFRVLASAVPSVPDEDDAARGAGNRTRRKVSRRRASLGGARRGARESKARRDAPIGMRATHSARVSTLPIDFAATWFRGLFSPTWGHPVGAPHQFNSHRSSHRTRPRWRSAAQPRSSRASRAPRSALRSSPPRYSPAACPAAWRGSRRGSPCRPSDRRTTSGTPHTPTSGSRCVPTRIPPTAVHRIQRRIDISVADIVAWTSSRSPIARVDAAEPASPDKPSHA